MEKETMKLVRKMQITIDLPTAEQKKQVWTKLYRWQDISVRAANLIMSHLYVQAMIKDFLYLSEGVRYKLLDEKKDKDGILQQSHSNVTYRMLSDRFKGQIPANILNYLNHELISKFKKHYMEYAQGTRSLDNFKPNKGFLFGTEGFKHLQYTEEKRAFSFQLFKIPFKVYLGKDYTDKYKLLQQLIEGKVKLCTSRMKLEKGKIFWLPVFEMPKEQQQLHPAIVAEASLSLEYPISVKIGKHFLKIGNKEEFLHQRLAIQAAHARTKTAVPYCKGGHGRKRKQKALIKFREMERNYVSSRLHEYSRRLIDFCVKHQAATLVLLDMEDKALIAKEERFVLRNWNYYELMKKIKYKAEKVGIELVVS